VSLHDILMKKARHNELAHFYLLEANDTQAGNEEALQNFVHEFVRDYYQKIEGHKQSMAHLMDHPDVFIIGNLATTEEPSDSFFTVPESEALARFFEFRPVQSKRKFAIITEAHRINTIVGNKWLKLLEEPQGESTIFMLNPRRQKLLETIHSRAIHLRLQVKSSEKGHEQWQELLSALDSMALSDFLENYSRAEKSLDFWIKELIDWEAEQIDQPSSKIALKEWLTDYQEMKTFNQPTATKWTLFYSYLHQHVLPRLTR
jgi:DNA polymerase III delta prime subunit